MIIPEAFDKANRKDREEREERDAKKEPTTSMLIEKVSNGYKAILNFHGGPSNYAPSVHKEVVFETTKSLQDFISLNF